MTSRNTDQTLAKPAIFITTDFNEQAGAAYPLDRTSIRDSIHETALWAMKNGHRIIVRDVPAVSGMLSYIFKDAAGSTEDLSVEPESASVAEIVAKHHPRVAVLAGGFAPTAADFDALQKEGNITLIPLPETGGASRAMFEQHKDTLKLPAPAVAALEQRTWGGLRQSLESCKGP